MNCIDQNRNEIETIIREILCKKLCRDAEDLSKLSVTELLYLYGEICAEFNILLTADDINNGCFSSLHDLIDTLCEKGNKK